jgi:sterol-4alpha-carboxylate 3-dehydrogenase (decarboxylating)
MVWSVNLDGSRHVLRACQEEGVPKLIYVSSASAVYEGKDIEGGDETMGYSRISQAPYADSKIAAEKMLLAANGHKGVHTVAIRPHVVFGPGDTRFLPAILARARAGRLRFGIGKGKLSDFTYVSNLIDALLRAELCLDAGENVAGEAFFVTNGEPMAFFDFVGAVLCKLSLPPIIGTIPYPIAYGVAALAEAIDTFRGGTLNAEDGFSRFAVRYMATHHYFSIEKARTRLGYVPRVNLAEGIDRTVAHLAPAN